MYMYIYITPLLPALRAPRPPSPARCAAGHASAPLCVIVSNAPKGNGIGATSS